MLWPRSVVVSIVFTCQRAELVAIVWHITAGVINKQDHWSDCGSTVSTGFMGSLLPCPGFSFLFVALVFHSLGEASKCRQLF